MPSAAKRQRAQDDTTVIANDADDASQHAAMVLLAQQESDALPAAVEAAPGESSIQAKTIKERQLERALGAHGTKEANDGIETDHIFMDTLYWLIRNIYKQLLRVYLRMQGDMLTRRFITERETTGRKIRGALALHRSNAVGCSERAEARKFMSVGYRVMLAALLMLVRTDARFKDLSINELDRALLWGCLRYRAWSPELTMAVVSQAGCFFGGLLALNVCNGGYATPMLEARCTLAPLQHARTDPLPQKRVPLPSTLAY